MLSCNEGLSTWAILIEEETPFKASVPMHVVLSLSCNCIKTGTFYLFQYLSIYEVVALRISEVANCWYDHYQAPAYTARLEVDYKQKVPAGTTILCSTELESIGECSWDSVVYRPCILALRNSRWCCFPGMHKCWARSPSWLDA